MNNWYKESKKRKKKKKNRKKLCDPYVIEDGVMKYRTEKGDYMIAEEDEDLEVESKKKPNHKIDDTVPPFKR